MSARLHNSNSGNVKILIFTISFLLTAWPDKKLKKIKALLLLHEIKIITLLKMKKKIVETLQDWLRN